MREIKAIIKPHRLDNVLDLLHQHPGLPGVTISHVEGFGHKVGRGTPESGESVHFGMAKFVKIECVVEDSMTEEILEVIRDAARTGGHGDGKIFISRVEEVMIIREE
jgi:nitrogen regulatory protein P-II 1